MKDIQTHRLFKDLVEQQKKALADQKTQTLEEVRAKAKWIKQSDTTKEQKLHLISPEEMDVSKLSKRMFWDTPIKNIDPVKHSRWIVERVMGYGSLEDWQIIKRWYGKEGLRSTVVKSRVLDAVSVSFLCLVLDLKKEDFRCYKERQLRPNFWTS